MSHSLLVLGCEPIPALFLGWAGSVTAALLFKTAAALAIVVLVKSALFAWFAKLGFLRGVAYMFVANLVSTIPGVIIGAFHSSPAAAFGVLLLILFAMGYACGRFFNKNLRETNWKWLTPVRFATISVVLSVISVFFLSFALEFEVHDRFATYWLMKFFGLFLVLLVSIPMTIAWEASIVLALSKGTDPVAILRATVLANFWTLFSMFLLAAALAIPHRLRRRGFLLPATW